MYHQEMAANFVRHSQQLKCRVVASLAMGPIWIANGHSGRHGLAVLSLAMEAFSLECAASLTLHQILDLDALDDSRTSEVVERQRASALAKIVC
jgi:hypothetical protein